MSVRALRARVYRLEQGRLPTSPFVIEFGSLDAFVDHIRDGVETGLFDRRDMIGPDGEGGVLRAILGWHRSGIFG